MPIYPKIRLTAELLVECATGWFQLAMRSGDACYRAALRVDLGYTMAGTYLRDCVLNAAHTAAQHRKLTELALSRYVGLVRFYDGMHRSFDLLFDSTTLRKRDALIGVVAFQELPTIVEQRIDELRQIRASQGLLSPGRVDLV